MAAGVPAILLQLLIRIAYQISALYLTYRAVGTTERVRVIDAVREVLRFTGHESEILLRPEMPTGPMNRVADNSRARKLLGWEP